MRSEIRAKDRVGARSKRRGGCEEQSHEALQIPQRLASLVANTLSLSRCRLDKDSIVDATMNGCMARFMNHCCIPNAYAETITIPDANKKREWDAHGKARVAYIKKIVIFAKTAIRAGEEVVYDYKFQVEDGSLACTCGHPQCIGAMN